MILATLCFYAFSAILVGSGVMVVTSRNPVHSVLFLILAFFNAAGLFVLLGAEFLAMLLVIVYVGAVAVLFLFVVMMLDVDFLEMREGFNRYLPIGLLIGLVLFAELVLVLGTWIVAPHALLAVTAVTPSPAAVSNTHALGNLLYTRYFYVFEASGLILLVAMIGAIVLTHRARDNVRRQATSTQVDRMRAQTVEIVRVPTRTGV